MFRQQPHRRPHHGLLLLSLALALLASRHGSSAFSSSSSSLLISPRSSSIRQSSHHHRLRCSSGKETTAPPAIHSDEESEWNRIQNGWADLVEGRAFDASSYSRLSAPEDVVGIAGNVPLVFESLRTAFTGEFSPEGYAICAATSFVTSCAHGKMTLDTPRDYRAPRLAEYRSVYEFSALYLVPFSWLLWRITPYFPARLEGVDGIMSALFTLVTVYGWAYAVYGKGLLERANNDPTYDGVLEPSSTEYQKQAQLYLTGNVVINSLACLFIPFAWTLTFRGTEWWERVQELHPNQAAFMGLSILVATIGDMSGNLLLRLQQLTIFRSPSAIVVCGILSNFWLLLFPEIVFNSIYSSGISEVGFYWE